MKKPVNTKRDFYERFYRGEFGNAGLMWPEGFAEWEASGYRGDVGIRTMGVGTRCDYNVPFEEVPSRFAEFRQTYRAEMINLSAMMPDEHMIVQGEITRTHKGLSAFVATVINTAMRPALLDHGFHLEGLRVDHLIRRSCDATSYDWLMSLVDDYDGHTIEFSALRIPWGTRNLNTVIWEVRNY